MIRTVDPVHAHLTHLRVRGLRPTTIRARHDQLRRLARHLHVDLGTLLAATPADLVDWQNSLIDRSPRYRQSASVHVRAFYRWAVDEELLVADPARALAAVRSPRSVPRPIGEDDLDLAIACAPDRIRAALVLAAYAGLRACEVAWLLRDHVQDTADPPVLHVTGKGGRDRIVPLSPRALLELRIYGLPMRGHVFRRKDGRPGGCSPALVSHLCNEYLRSMGIESTMHTLRHRFGTAVYAASLDLRMTGEVMGHADPRTTAGYVAWSAAAAVAAVGALPGAALSDEAVLR